jgi:endonuclease/exonuclease/phosphatase family metal-dependent hydrolase
MKGEYSPILYPTQIFKLLHYENTWLSPTPHKPSKGWDAGLKRILTSGVFEHKLTNRRLAVFNTHLDHAGIEAREKSVGIILSVIERIRSEWCRSTEGELSGASVEGLDYVLAGDFNSFPTQEAYRAMVKSNKAVDVHEAVSARERYGSENTFTGFEPDTDKDKDEIGRIDFVWLGPRERVHDLDADLKASRGWHVQGYSVLPNVFDDGVFCSDHRCVVADAFLI